MNKGWKQIGLAILVLLMAACGTEGAANDPDANDNMQSEIGEEGAEDTGGADTEQNLDSLDNEANDGQENDAEQESSFQPVTIDNFDRTFTIEQIPERAVSLNLQTTEIMLALGLGDHMVATSYGNDEILPEYKAEYERLPELAEQWPSLEVLLDVEPDFVYGRAGAFSEGEAAIAPVEEPEGYGMHVYVDTDSYQEGTTIEEVFTDLINLGTIFDVEEQAREIVDAMEEQVTEVQDVLAGREGDDPVRVLVFDMGGDDVFTAGGGSLQSHLIEQAGGHNVFDDVPKTWARVSWEEVVERDPEVIIINDYGDTDAEEKIEEIMQQDVLQDVQAVQDERFFIVRLTSVFASIQNAEVIAEMAQYFYPDLFD
jgi:iron complex transport system substrate-binding protein